MMPSGASSNATSTSALVKSTLSLMAWIKTKTGLVVTTVILLGGATTVVINHQALFDPAPPQPPRAPARPPLPTADDGRLGGRMPDWPGMVARAQSPEEKEQIQKIWCLDRFEMSDQCCKRTCRIHLGTLEGGACWACQMDGRWR